MIRSILRDAIGPFLPRTFYFCHAGWCPCCRRTTKFLATDAWLRDRLRCVVCHSIPRQRALVRVLETSVPEWPNVSVHESSPTGGGASDRVRADCREYVASQYHPSLSPGSMVESHRNENLEALTFPDASFDVVITQDVMEHVYDPAAAFREIARTLKPGGMHVFTVPLVNKHRPSQVWATRRPDGSPAFAFEPEYHGNPVDARGSPVTMHWGYDIVDFIRKATGDETSIEYTNDLSIGVWAEFIEVLVTRKTA